MDVTLIAAVLVCFAAPLGEAHAQHTEVPELPEFVLIGGGTFVMGTPIANKYDEEYHEDEAPLKVEVKSFLIAKTPVTSTQFCQFLNSADAAAYKPSELYWHGRIGTYAYSTIRRENGRSVPFPGAERSPANQVTWKGAVLYCRWLSKLTGDSYRLPTEAECEYAARGSEGRRWPWGKEEPDKTRGYRRIATWQTDEQAIQTSPVGSYPGGATPDGVMDILGYVIGEWCVNRYVEHPTAADVTNARADVDDLTSERVVRGYYNREHRSIGTWKGALIYRSRGTYHPGHVWTRWREPPILAPRAAARYGFRVVKEP